MQKQYDFSQGIRGAVANASGKTQITLFLDDEVLAAFRERALQQGKGCQTLINETLKASLSPESQPVTVELLRQVLQEEL